MNRVYKTIWNEQTGTYVAVSELSHARGKRSGSSVQKSSAGSMLRSGVLALAGAGLMGVAGTAAAVPGGACETNTTASYYGTSGPTAYKVTSGECVAPDGTAITIEGQDNAYAVYVDGASAVFESSNSNIRSETINKV